MPKKDAFIQVLTNKRQTVLTITSRSAEDDYVLRDEFLLRWSEP
jgi:hypothetical protein